MGMRRSFHQWGAFDIRDQLNEWYPAEMFDIVLKCWDLNFPAPMPKQHCGEHTEITRACIESPGFQMLMDECRDHAYSLWACGQNNIRVMCICGEGKHRSVAVSSTLRSVYLRLGFNSLGPFHLSELEGGWRGMCNTCKHCKPNAYKDAMVTALEHHLACGADNEDQ